MEAGVAPTPHAAPTRVASALLLAGCLACGGRFAALPPSAPPPGSYERHLELPASGGDRSYLVYVPPRPDPAAPMPLVLALHGGLSSGETLMGRTSFRELADREGLLVAFPNGWGPGGFLRHWNAVHCCTLGPGPHQDDIAFLDAVIQDLAAHLPVERSRVFVVGISNGGMLAYRYAAVRSTRVAGVAALESSIAGALRNEDPALRMPDLEVPVPLIVFHGSADRRVPYADVEPSLEFWLAQDGCDPVPQTRELRQGRVTRVRWAACRGGAEVELYRLEGWGHSWPGPRFTGQLDPGDPLAGFDAVPVMWEFFRRQAPRPPS